MYSAFQLVKKYFKYYLSASNGKGHGIHSPFVFDFIINVLNDKKHYPDYDLIEARRQVLRNDETVIDVEDFGAGSAVIKTNKRVVKDIARSSLKPKKYAQLLYRIVKYYKPENIVEIGSSFGVTTAYLASANPKTKIFSAEGATAIAGIATQTFDILQLKNVELHKGDFKNSLPEILSKINFTGLAFVDGNHRKEATLQYFEALLKHSTIDTILIFDDIHWSEGMEAAWQQIKAHKAVTLSIDLFFIGIVFFNTRFKEKQDFVIRF